MTALATFPAFAPESQLRTWGGQQRVMGRVAFDRPGLAPAAGRRRIRLDAVSDDDLVRRAQRGDSVAFASLFREHRSQVARIVARMLGPAGDVDDVVQEVFLQVHRSLGDFRGQAKLSTWLHRLTVNVVLMTRRSARSRPVLVEDKSEDRPALGGRPDDEAAQRRRAAALYRLLDRISDKKREVFVMHDIEGLTALRIGELVGAPVLTVRTRLFYARKELATMLRDEPSLAELADELNVSSPNGAREDSE